MSNFDAINIKNSLAEQDILLGSSRSELTWCCDDELASSNTGNVFKHVIIRLTSNLKFSNNPKKNFEMLQNSIFDKYLADLDKKIEVWGNGKSLNFKLMVDPSIDLESIKNLGIHDVVHSLLSWANWNFLWWWIAKKGKLI